MRNFDLELHKFTGELHILCKTAHEKISAMYEIFSPISAL